MLGTVTGIETAVDGVSEPQELYDTLTETEQGVFDLIGAMGFKPDKDDAGRWVGLSISGDDLIGPVGTLSKLHKAVEDFVESFDLGVDDTPLTDALLAAEDLTTEGTEDGDSEGSDDSETLEAQVELTEDHRGRVFLPGTGPIVDQQLADAAGEFLAADIEWKDAGKRRTTAQQALRTTAGLKKDLFTPDPDNSNAVIYHAGGITIRISKTEKEEIKCFSDEEVEAG